MPLDGEEHPLKVGLRRARDAALDRLSEGFARNELSLEEFERRVDAAYGAGAERELAELVADLRALAANELSVVPPSELVAAPPPAGKPARLALAVFGSVERRVLGQISSGAAVIAVFGNVELDLRDLELPPGATELRVRAVLGNVVLTVPPTVALECRGASIFGSFASIDRLPGQASGEAVLRVVGSAVFGNVEIRTLPARARLEAGRRHLLRAADD